MLGAPSREIDEEFLLERGQRLTEGVKACWKLAWRVRVAAKAAK
jgi:hypothetical protein